MLIRTIFILSCFLHSLAVAGDFSLSSAFDVREFVMQEIPVISPNGEIIAYSVKQNPDNVTLNERRQLDGTPISCVGSRIYLVHIDSGKSYDIDTTLLGDCWRPTWSPDGSKIAFYSNTDGMVQLWLYDLSTKQSKKISNAPIKSNIFSVDKPAWDLHGKLLYVPLDPTEKTKQASPVDTHKPTIKTFSSKDKVTVIERGDQSFYIREYSTQIAAIDVETGSVKILVSNHADPAPGFLKISPTGKWLAYVSRPIYDGSPNLAHCDSAIISTTGQGEPMKIGTGAGRFSFDCQTWHPTLDLLAYIRDKKLYLVQMVENGPPIVKLMYENPDFELVTDFLLFDAIGSHIIVGANIEKNDYRKKPQDLLVIPLDQQQPTREIRLAGKWHCIDILKADNSCIWQSEESTLSLLLEDQENAETNIVRFDLHETKEPEVLWKGEARITDFFSHSNTQQVFFKYEDFNTPPDLYCVDRSFTHMKRLTSIDPRIENRLAATKEVFETVVTDYNGELKKVRTTVLIPSGAKRGDRLPGIVVFYPGAAYVASKVSKKFSGVDAITVPNFLFLERGYVMIFADTILGPEGTAGNPVQEIADTLLPQIHRAVELGYVDGDRLAITGHSYGGYGTAAVITKTDLFKAAVAISGMYDLGGNYGDFRDDGLDWIDWAEHGQGRMGTHPWANLSRYLTNSPYYLADKITTPLLLVHGEEDFCNVQEPKKLFFALKRLGKEVDLAIYPGQGHCINVWERPYAIDAAQRILNFMDSKLGFVQFTTEYD